MALLAMLAADVFVIPVLLTQGLVPHRFGDVVFAGTMIVAIGAMGRGEGRIAVLGIALAAFTVQFFRFMEHDRVVIMADALLSALAMATFAGMVLRDVFGRDPVPDRLLDVILAYLLVGAAFAFVYEAVNVAIPGSLTMDGHAVSSADYIYFSITTMTSVGFGDALPRNPIMRAVAMSQALTGQLYVAVLIARFANPSRKGGGTSP